MINRQVAPIWAVCLVVLAAGCGSCADRRKMATGEPDASAPDAGSPEMEDVSGVGVEGAVLDPAFITLLGQPDTDNFYDSTVFLDPVEVPDGPHYRSCSGVLVASNLALTAAHCLCAPPHGQTTRFDGSNCAAKAEVHIRVPRPSVGAGRAGRGLELTGNVLIHPQFEIVLDTKGAVVTSRADLALVRLEEPIPPDLQLVPTRLATEDVRARELVIVVGFGVYDDGSLDYRSRESSREIVEFPAGDDRYFFGLEKDASFKGDTGGPCLRQTKCGQELVGISQRGLGLKPALTRIAPYRKWIEEQIRLAGEKR